MNPYNKLGVDEDADEKDIKKSYRKKAAKSHPDKGGAPEDFKELAVAYSILSDPLKRMKFDDDSPYPDIVCIALKNSITDLDLQKQAAEKEHKVLKLAIEMVEYYSMPQHARPHGMIGNNTFGDLIGGRFA